MVCMLLFINIQYIDTILSVFYVLNFWEKCEIRKLMIQQMSKSPFCQTP